MRKMLVPIKKEETSIRKKLAPVDKNNKKLSSDDKLEQAILLQQEWRFDEAKEQYEALLKESPEDANAHHNLGVLYSVQLLEPVAALPHFEAALNFNPTKLQFWFSYLDALIKANALDAAENVLELARHYGLNDLQVGSFERDIRLARTTVADLIAMALEDAPPLPEPQPIGAAPSLIGEDPPVAELHQLLSFFNQKKYDRLIKSASTLLKRFPKAVSAWTLLAEAQKRTGNLERALEARHQVALLQPTDLSVQIAWIDALLVVGENSEAEAALQTVLLIQPDYAPAHGRMGQLYQLQGESKKSIQSYARALQQEKFNPIFLEKFGSLLRGQGDQDAALVCFKSAVEASPNSAELLDAYGITLRNQERLAAAENAFRKALKLHPGYTPALRHLCHLLEIHGRFAEAEAGLLRCAEIENDSPESLYEIGRNLVQQKKEVEALDWLRRAIKAKPDYDLAHISLSAALNSTDDPLAAMEELKESIKQLPNIPHLYTNLGIINLSLSRADDAIACFRKALEINPRFSHARSSMLFALSHSTKITPEELYREHRAYGKLIEEEIKGKEYTTYSNSRTTDRPLKIGFVSADFRNHAVAKFVIPFFEELHKRPEFITYAYSNHGAVDESMLAIQKNMDVWRTVVQWSDDKLAEKIREDQIDILVDMSGHTAGDRLKVFARHPAPVQMTWLGYPGTTGLKAMDYRIEEHYFFDRTEMEKQFTEKIAQIPYVSLFDKSSSDVGVLEAPAIKNGYITFGSFNRLNKINKEVVELWCKALHLIPTGRLVMGGMPVNGPPKELIQWFLDAGIDVDERVSFYSRTGFIDYLKLHNYIDFCLDTFPYSGGTTTNHALWMGVPTLTLGCSTYPSLQSAYLLRRVGLDTLFWAKDEQEFLEKVVFLSESVELLNNIRGKLRKKLESEYLDRVKVTIDGFSYALKHMWMLWVAGSKAKSFTITDEDVGYQRVVNFFE